MIGSFVTTTSFISVCSYVATPTLWSHALVHFNKEPINGFSMSIKKEDFYLSISYNLPQTSMKTIVCSIGIIFSNLLEPILFSRVHDRFLTLITLQEVGQK